MVSLAAARAASSPACETLIARYGEIRGSRRAPSPPATGIDRWKPASSARLSDGLLVVLPTDERILRACWAAPSANPTRRSVDPPNLAPCTVEKRGDQR